jgi:hypothetical protein
MADYFAELILRFGQEETTSTVKSSYTLIAKPLGSEVADNSTYLSIGSSGRFLNHTIYTPEDQYGLEGLAITLFYVAFGLLRVEFPLSLRSNPSSFVLVERTNTPLLSNSDGVMYPMKLDWKFWAEIMVPLLQEDRWKINNMLTTNIFGVKSRQSLVKSYDSQIPLLREAVKQQLQLKGLIPND